MKTVTMGNNKFFAGFLMMIVLMAILHGPSLADPVPEPEPQPVNLLCALVSCLRGTTCRVIQSCSGPACPPQAACLLCVPEGVDDVCNRNRYFFAILVGSSSVPENLQERKCDPMQPNGEPNCPDGTVCVADGNGRGTCCFGNPDPAPEVGTVISNGNPVCDRCGGCDPGFVCKPQEVTCATDPCPPVFACVKPGICPIWLRYFPLGHCPKTRDHLCNNDADCREITKCCPNRCGDRRCVFPSILSFLKK